MAALIEDWRGVVEDPQERAMLAFAEKIAGDAYKMTEADVEGLREVGFSDLEILEIVAAATYRVYISKFADALGVRLDDRWFEESADAVEAFTVGRPALRHGEE